MKRIGFVVVGAWALAVFACTGERPPVTPDPGAADAAPAPPSDAPDATPGPATTVTMTTTDAGTAPAQAAPLPPPKPATTPLASPANDAVDKELVLGDAAFEANDLPGAKKHYDAARKLDPTGKRPGPLVGLARVRAAATNVPYDVGAGKGNAELAAAAKELRAAAALDDGYGPAHAELGRTLLLLGDADGALAELKKGAQLLPNDAEVQSSLGGALLASGKKDEALAPLQRAAQLDMGRAERHGNLGTVMLLLGRVADAVKEFELQARLADGDARAHADLGAALLFVPDLPRATRELERAVQLDPSRASYHTSLGTAYKQSGRITDALREYREALKRDDKFVSALIGVATVLALDPRTRGDARAALLKAKVIDPTDPRIEANLKELDELEKH
jgi:Flp pilus assembly protein TadD